MVTAMTEQTKPDRPKVVQLNVERNASTNSQVALARLPAAMHSLRDKARQQLQGVLCELFDKVDDAMFELADKATNNHDQNIFFDSMREVRIRRRAMETAFFRSIDISFAQLLDHNAYRDEQSDDEKAPSLDDLSLVRNDELEEMVATEGMVNKANEQFAEAIQHLTLRIDHLVPIKVYQKNNPLGVDVICHAFTGATKSLHIDVKAKLVLFKLFDNMVMGKLGKLYEALNQTLIDANILPSLKQAARPKKPSAPTAAPAGHYGSGASANQTHSNQPANGQLISGNNNSQSYDEQTNQVLHTLRDLLGSRGGNQAPSVSGAEIATTDLIKILSLAQHQNYGATQSNNTVQPLNLRSMLNDLLRNETEKPAAINQVDDDVINLVSMMFEFILDDRNLAAPMKALIGRLQIPMVKVAIADKSFFSKGGHPARRLLNEMAMACLGWQEASDENQRKDSLYNKMEETVRVILTDFETDMDIFNTLLVDFRAFLEKDKRRAQILEQRTLDAEDGKAKSERARAQVDVVLNRICVGKELPITATKLLREAWANVMFITCLKQGIESQEWKDKTLTAQQLVWSVTVAMDKENRQRLLKLVPDLLQKLRAGLESISFSPFETTQLFKQLETIHLARLRGDVQAKPIAEAQASATSAEVLAAKARELAAKNASLRAPAIVPSLAQQAPVQEAPKAATKVLPAVSDDHTAHAVAQAREATVAVPENMAAPANIEAPVIVATEQVLLSEPEITVPEVVTTTLAEQSFIVVETSEPDVIDQTQQADAQHLSLVNNITQGTWFEMQGEAGEKYRCRLAAIIRPVGKYIFVNRSGMKVAEESRESLAIALQNKRLTILDDGMLFDRALESVISNLRDKRMLS